MVGFSVIWSALFLSDGWFTDHWTVLFLSNGWFIGHWTVFVVVVVVVVVFLSDGWFAGHLVCFVCLWWLVYRSIGLFCFSLVVGLPVHWSVLYLSGGWFTGPLVCFVSLWWLVYRSLNGFILLWWLVYRSLNGVVSLWWLVYRSLNGFIPLWWLVNQSEFELTLDELWPPRQALEVSRSFHYCFLVTLGCVFLNSANHNVHTCIRCQFLKSFSALNGTGEHEREFIKCVFHLNSSELRRWVFLLK